MPFSRARFAAVVTFAVALALPAAAQADDQMVATTRGYYANEMTTSYLFMGYGAVTAGAGAVSLTQSGDFNRGFGWSSLIAGGLTVLGGAAYGVAVKVRGDYYEGLAAKDPVQFKREESDRIEGTNKRFMLYLGSEILEALAGIGVATYGFVAKDDLTKGIGVGAAIQGIGLLVIDAPGAGRAAKYQEDVRRFNPQVGVSVGGGDRPWAATVGHAF
jgi:hypothetical protein